MAAADDAALEDSLDAAGDIGGRIRAGRLRLGVTQVQLAETLGVRQPSVAKWEMGECRPRLSKLQRIARALEVEFDWLARGAGAPPPPRPETRQARPRYLSRPLLHVPVFLWPEDARGFDPCLLDPVDFIACAIDAERPFAIQTSGARVGAPMARDVVLMFEAADRSLRPEACHLIDADGRAAFGRWRIEPDRLEPLRPGGDALFFGHERPRPLGRALSFTEILDPSFAIEA